LLSWAATSAFDWPVLGGLALYAVSGSGIALLLAWRRFQQQEREEELDRWNEAGVKQAASVGVMQRAQ